MHVKIAITVETMGKLLQEQDLRIATAEVYTAGGLAYFINTSSSDSFYFDRGFIVYNALAKQEQLNIPSNMLKKYGAASRRITEAMAEGAILNSLANVSIAVSDITHGGLWFAWAREGHPTISLYKKFKGKKQEICLEAILFALQHQIKLLL